MGSDSLSGNYLRRVGALEVVAVASFTQKRRRQTQDGGLKEEKPSEKARGSRHRVERACGDWL